MGLLRDHHHHHQHHLLTKWKTLSILWSWWFMIFQEGSFFLRLFGGHCGGVCDLRFPWFLEKMQTIMVWKYGLVNDRVFHFVRGWWWWWWWWFISNHSLMGCEWSLFLGFGKILWYEQYGKKRQRYDTMVTWCLSICFCLWFWGFQNRKLGSRMKFSQILDYTHREIRAYFRNWGEVTGTNIYMYVFWTSSIQDMFVYNGQHINGYLFKTKFVVNLLAYKCKYVRHMSEKNQHIYCHHSFSAASTKSTYHTYVTMCTVYSYMQKLYLVAVPPEAAQHPLSHLHFRVASRPAIWWCFLTMPACMNWPDRGENQIKLNWMIRCTWKHDHKRYCKYMSPVYFECLWTKQTSRRIQYICIYMTFRSFIMSSPILPTSLIETSYQYLAAWKKNIHKGITASPQPALWAPTVLATPSADEASTDKELQELECLPVSTPGKLA